MYTAWDLDVDVVVLGHGAAGCAAAIEAGDTGADVLLLEKLPAGQAGGNTRVSGGAWFEPRDVERAAVYLRSLCGGYQVPEPVIRAWAAETCRNTTWMRDEHVPVRSVHVIFDEATRRSGPISSNRSMMPVGWNVLVEDYDWSVDNSVEIEKGWIHRADTVAGLATALEVVPAVLEASVARYNAACHAGHDDQFGRPAETLTPLQEGPFYAFTSAPLVAWSNGGPRRNERCEVLDPFGETIRGLYAAGSVSSTYSWCKDGGMHIADALAFGRVAGREAANNAERSQP